MGSIKQFLLKITLYIKYILSYVIPKKKNHYLFMPMRKLDRLSGNIKALIVYIEKHNPEIKMAVRMSKNLAEDMTKYNVEVKNTFWGIWWAELRAEYIVIDASTAKYKNGNYSLIQLWHGAGYKNIGLLHSHVNEKTLSIFEKNYRKYKLVAATSQSDLEKRNSSFGVDTTKITGYPRNDVFFEKKSQDVFKSRYALESYDKIITYAPTYRNEMTTPPFSESFLSSLNAYLRSVNSIFIINKHPNDKFLNVPKDLSHIKDMTEEINDVQELLVITDILITDYSSIATDFAITNRPLIIYAYDFEDYIKKSRTMYYDLQETLPQPIIDNENELFEKIKNTSWFDNLENQKSYQKFQDTFHHYLDGNSSKRILKEILDLKK